MKSSELLLSATGLTELIEDVISKNASFRFKVKGFSMAPFIRDADIVTISPLPNSALSIGKVVAFTHPKTNAVSIHRLVGREGNNYLIKGDNCLEADGLIPIDNILGYVTKVERDGKRIFLGLGIERLIIAFLNKTQILPRLFSMLRLIPFSIRRVITKIIL